jgi:MutS domain III/MutS family domain IV
VHPERSRACVDAIAESTMHFNRFKRKKQRRPLGARDLQEKVDGMGGQTGLALELELDPTSIDLPAAHVNSSAGVYGQRRNMASSSSSLYRTRLFQTPTNTTGRANDTARSVAQSTASRLSRFSRASTTRPTTQAASTMAVHIVCAVSENLARETCVSSIDAGSPTSIYVTKQGNGQTYAETIAYLDILKPDEVLLNEGRRNSQLARKVMELYNVKSTAMELPMEENRRQRLRRDGGDEDETLEEDRYGSMGSSTVVKFISRSCFDQTKGAELLQKVAREETYDATMVEEYILLSSAHAVLNYVQQSLGATFLKNSVYLSINSGGNNRMAIDRSTVLQLELLVNSKTGNVKDSLIGTIDCTKTTVGSRLLRTNLMSPPARVDTINTRLELVDLFLSNAEFFYAVLEHLSSLPDVDKMLSNIALVPRKATTAHKGKDDDGGMVNERMASKGISALVCIKTTLQALPSFAGVLQNHLQAMDSHNAGTDDASVVTDRSSLLVGLGGGGPPHHLNRHHLLRAIIFAMTQPALATVLGAVSGVFTETTTFSRNANVMRHQECFAFMCEENGMMSVLRKAFLANVDDIYKKADEYAEVYGISVSVRYSSSRGYYLAVPVDVGTDLPQVFLQPAKSGRFINCTTEEITSLNTRAQDNVHDLLLMTHDRIQEVMDVARNHYDVIATLCDAVALLDMCHSFADNVLTHRYAQF